MNKIKETQALVLEILVYQTKSYGQEHLPFEQISVYARFCQGIFA